MQFANFGILYHNLYQTVAVIQRAKIMDSNDPYHHPCQEIKA